MSVVLLNILMMAWVGLILENIWPLEWQGQAGSNVTSFVDSEELRVQDGLVMIGNHELSN